MSSQFDPKASMQRCMKYRKKILDISQQVGALHAAASFSAMEMVDTIYHGLMRRNEQGEFLDAFLMSKGHGCIIQYVILQDLGILRQEDLDRYCKPDGILGCHPDYGTPGIEASTGSLGHGMGLATGMAHVDRIKRLDRKTYIMISDGELQEGSTWECMMMAANLKLNSIVGFLDHNGYQSFGKTAETHPSFYPIKEKIEAFGWETATVNGHEAGSVYQAVSSRKGDRPFMLIGNTVKGRGVSYMENVPIWHYRSPTGDEYQQAVRELKEVAS